VSDADVRACVQGTMWVSANYICFDSRLMRQKFVIAFRNVVKITKGTSHFGVLDSSLSIHTKQGEEVLLTPPLPPSSPP